MDEFRDIRVRIVKALFVKLALLRIANLYYLAILSYFRTPTPATSDILPVIWEPLDDGTNLRYIDIGKELQMKTMTNIEQRYLSAKTSSKES